MSKKCKSQILLCLGFFFIISVIFFYPTWLKGKLPLPLDALVGAHLPWIEVKWDGYPAGVPIKNQEITDAISQFYPWRSLVGEFWRNGEFPLWNRFMLSGTPFLATLHSAGLYPLNALYLVFNDSAAWTLLLFLQIFLSGIFMFLFLRELGIKKVASVFGGLVFSLSGYMIAWLEFATGGQAGLWLPLLLLFELKLIKKNKNKYVIPISVIFFFIYTAGDFQVPFYVTTTYILFGVYLIFLEGKLKERLIRSRNVILAWTLGVFLSLPQLLPTLELFQNSIRLSDPYIKMYFYGLMNWSKITNFLWPDFFGNVVTRNYWANYGYHEYLAFTGIVSVGLLIYSLFNKKGHIEKFFWIILVFSLIFLFPTPLAFLPFKLKIPGLGTSSASRIIFLVDFSIAVLSAYGFSKWIKNKDHKLIKVYVYLIVVTLGVFLGLLISLNFMQKGNLTDEIKMVTNLKVAIKNMIPSTAVIVSLLAVLFIDKLRLVKKRKYIYLMIILIATAEMLRFAWKNTPFSDKEFLFPTTKTIEFLVNQKEPFRIAGPGIPMNYFMQYKIGSVEGYDPIYPAANAQWFSIANFGDTKHLSGRYGELSDFSSSLIDYANVKYVVDYLKFIQSKAPDKSGSFSKGIDADRFKQVASEGRVSILENTTSLPRVWLSTNYDYSEEKDELLIALTSTKSSDKRIILEKKPDFTLKEQDFSYEISDFGQERNKIALSSYSTADSLLFLSESYNNGWRAFIDGEEVKVYKANYLFQSIYLPKGEHEIEFIYDPKSFKLGLRVSAFTVFLLAVLYIFEKRKVLWKVK